MHSPLPYALHAPLPPNLLPMPLTSTRLLFSKVLGVPMQGIQCLDCRSFYEAVGTWGHEGGPLPACGHVLPPGVCFCTVPHARIFSIKERSVGNVLHHDTARTAVGNFLEPKRRAAGIASTSVFCMFDHLHHQASNHFLASAGWC